MSDVKALLGPHRFLHKDKRGTHVVVNTLVHQVLPAGMSGLILSVGATGNGSSLHFGHEYLSNQLLNQSAADDVRNSTILFIIHTVEERDPLNLYLS